MDDRLPEAQLARAIDRALEFERAARAAVMDCERQCAESVQRALDRRRAILERARLRIVALHARCTEALERRLAAAASEDGQKSAAALAKLSDPLQRRRALERLAAALTTPSPQPSGDAP